MSFLMRSSFARSGFLAIIAVLLSYSSLASTARVACAKDTACQKLEEAIRLVGELKARRHEDVAHFGRKSTQVKEDDRQLEQALQEDHELRQVRRQAQAVSKSSAHRKHRWRANKPAPQGRTGAPSDQPSWSISATAKVGSISGSSPPARFKLR